MIRAAAGRAPRAARFALLAAVQLAVALALLALIEVGLRLAGIGEPDATRTSRFTYQQVHLPLLETGTRGDGVAIHRSADRRLPYQSILAAKPANGLRVITLGGSATAGLGYSPNVTFARELERMLVRAYPERHVEMLNLGIVALATKQVTLIAADAARRYAPDLLIVYAGNNEFLEIHAEKYAAAHTTLATALADHVSDLNLARAATRAFGGPPATPSLASIEASPDALRLSQREIIQSIDVSAAEVAAVVDAYEANLAAMSRDARSTGTPLLLATVVGNWQWHSRRGLPEGWLREFAGDGPLDAAAYARASAQLAQRLAAAPAAERYEWLFRRAALAEALGDHRAAVRRYREAMSADFHRRRATDEMADRVRKVAAENAVPVFDAIEYLAARSEHGIIGFAELYDYVHFTPRGALLMAAGLFETGWRSGLLPVPSRFDLPAHLDERMAAITAPVEDALDVREWMGFCFDPSMIGDRDLWKYDRMIRTLQARIADAPDDARALAYLGNARAFEIGGAAEATRLWAAALAADPHLPSVESNRARLRVEHGR